MPTHAATSWQAILFCSLCLFPARCLPAAFSQGDYPIEPIEIKMGDGVVSVTTRNEPFATYDFKHYAKPILYPLHGPGGVAVTRNYPMKAGVAGESLDHEHHKSVWFAHGDVNGLDFWSEKARIANHDVQLLNEEPNNWPGFVTKNSWLDGDTPILSEQATLRFANRGDVCFVDFEFLLTAQIDVRFGDTKEGTFAIRTHPNLQLKRDDASLLVGHAENSAGQTDGDIWGQCAKWVSYFGQIDGVDMGIAIFDHPENLRHPTTWHARDYGLVAANPFGLHDFLKKPANSGDFELPKGNQLKLRYRLAIYRGNFDREVIICYYDEFSDSTFGNR